MRKTLITLAAVVLTGTQVLAAGRVKKGSGGALKNGTYTATVKALTCAACPPAVEKALKAFPELENVSVSQEKSLVSFSVKKGASIKTAKLQAALKAASDGIGMGADYTLKNIKPAQAVSHEHGMEGMH